MGMSAVLLDGCKGKDGEPGAQGPAGTNGNANVIGSNSTTVNSWTLNSGILYSATLSWPSITQEIVDKGAVMVYESDGSGGWAALPYTIAMTSSTYSFGLGFVNIYVTNTDGSSPSNPGSINYRVVAMTSRQMQEHPNLDMTNYYAVKNALAIRE